jgi:peptidoglycan/LPS O-acetylase OafA/YrhL
VIWQHWFPSVLTDYLKMGYIGVSFFFVISGFLISEILIRNKNKLRIGELTAGNYFKNFYIRRILRIFPIYYLTVFFILRYNIDFCRPFGLYYLTYTSNFYNFFEQKLISFNYFWSLCVEEQFYFLFPVLIFLTPKQSLLKVIVAIILMGPIFRTIIHLNAPNPVLFAHPFSSFDGFGLGAFIAYLRVEKGMTFEDILENPICKWAAYFAVSLFFIFSTIHYVLPGVSFMLYAEGLYYAIIFTLGGYFILKFGNGFYGGLSLLINNRLLMYIGQISYSLYIFHQLLVKSSIHFGTEKYIPFDGYYKTLYLFGLIVISTLSWYLFESPINNAKKYFSY